MTEYIVIFKKNLGKLIFDLITGHLSQKNLLCIPRNLGLQKDGKIM